MNSFSQRGIVRITPILFIVAAVGLISFLLISSSAPFNSRKSLFQNLYQKPAADAATKAMLTAVSFGYGTIGTFTDSGDSGSMNGSKFNSGTGGTVVNMSVYVANVSASPKNQYQLAIYSDNAGKPGNLVTKSGSAILSANSWNTASISATLAANTNFWLMYNTNGANSSSNNMTYSSSGTDAYSIAAQAFGSWPTTFGTSHIGTSNFSIYVTYSGAPAPTSIPSASPAPTSTAAPPSGNLIFDDEFNGTALDTNAWVALNRGGDTGNREQQCYLPSNVTASGGNVTLLSKQDSAGCAGIGTSYGYSSAMIQWKNFNFTYGMVEIRAKEAGGVGTWPSEWMLGANCQQTNILSADNSGICQWPTPGSDELDITEFTNGLLSNPGQHLITGSSPTVPTEVGCAPTVSDASQNYHTYTLIWAPGLLTWQVDGVTTCTRNANVPSNPMFLMINTALGGNGGGTINPSTLPQSHSVDYVRVYSNSTTVIPTPVPTPSPTPNPTGSALGFTSQGTSIDTGDANNLNGSRYTMGSQNGTVTSMSVYVGGIDANSANRNYQMSIYADNNGVPGNLIATSSPGTLAGYTWNSLPINATLNANTSYWLIFNSNGSNSGVNNMAYTNVGPGKGTYSSKGVTFGTWPQPFGSAATSANVSFSIYASYNPF